MSKKTVTNKNEQEFSRFISYILRHKPEDIGLSLDENAYVSVENLINAINTNENSNYIIDMTMLEKVVA